MFNIFFNILYAVVDLVNATLSLSISLYLNPGCVLVSYPFVADLQHLGEEEQQQVGPGLSVAF